MKTYEEMARDVLKRRDEELQKLEQLQRSSKNNATPEVVYPASSKKRGLLPKIAIPCAAAVAVAAVSAGIRYNTTRLVDNDRFAATVDSSSDHSVSDTTSGAQDTLEKKININEGRPEYLKTHAFYNGRCIDGPVDHILYTVEDLNSYYGIEFDRLGRLHEDWIESNTRIFGIYVRSGADGENGGGAAEGVGELVASNNTLHYHLTDKSESIDISVSAELIGTPEDVFSPFDSSVYDGPDIFSVINGKNVLIYREDWYEGGDYWNAIIEMGNTLVEITSNTLSKEEFLNVIDEYTAPDDRSETENSNNNRETEDRFNILGSVPVSGKNSIDITPDYIREYPDEFPGVTFESYTIESINGMYDIEFDRLGRLHKDWEEHGTDDLGVFSRDQTSNDTSGTGKSETICSLNSLYYFTPNGSEIDVTADYGGLDFIYPDGKSIVDADISYVNGYKALIFDSYFGSCDAVERPNNDAKFTAFIEKKGELDVLVKIRSHGLSEEEFINVLKEYTADTTNDEAADISYTSFGASDPVDLRINYEVKVSENKIALGQMTAVEYSYKTDDSTVASGYLKDFFGNDDLPIDEAYRANLVRYLFNAHFECKVAPDTSVHTPVDGKVIGVAEGYNGGLGMTVAVEFGDKVFIVAHLDDVSVKAGDEITAGQSLGVCGTTGMVEAGSPQLTLITMNKNTDNIQA